MTRARDVMTLNSMHTSHITAFALQYL